MIYYYQQSLCPRPPHLQVSSWSAAFHCSVCWLIESRTKIKPNWLAFQSFQHISRSSFKQWSWLRCGPSFMWLTTVTSWCWYAQKNSANGLICGRMSGLQTAKNSSCHPTFHDSPLAPFAALIQFKSLMITSRVAASPAPTYLSSLVNLFDLQTNDD